jgi:ferredoxin/flavodoxin---NADP+ reductase
MGGPARTTALQIAIVGSGPSGFYAAEALLRCGRSVQVSMFERLPAPFGLVRYGVAPDHPKLKEPIQVYDRIARTEGFEFFGNVHIGVDISFAELRTHYDAVILACGAQADRPLAIPGEDLPGSHSALEFVGWYNGHPDYRDRSFDLTGEVAVIIGQGNVAADLCRMLAKPIDELRGTDVAEHALDALAHSKIREIHVIGRRGPTQAKFTSKELRELGEIPGAQALAAPSDLQLNSESETEIADKRNFVAAKNMEIFRAWSMIPNTSAPKNILFDFLQSPIEIRGHSKVERMILSRNRLEGSPFQQRPYATGAQTELACDLVLRSAGYRCVAIPGIPFDTALSVIGNRGGRVIDESGSEIPGLYVTGWAKRGPTGIIGTNRADSVETVKALLSDLESVAHGPKEGNKNIRSLLSRNGIRIVSYEDWLRIDAIELARGVERNKPREKFASVSNMLACID